MGTRYFGKNYKEKKKPAVRPVEPPPQRNTPVDISPLVKQLEDIKKLLPKRQDPVEYNFEIKRNKDGLMNNIVARPVSKSLMG